MELCLPPEVPLLALQSPTGVFPDSSPSLLLFLCSYFYSSFYAFSFLTTPSIFFLFANVFLPLIPLHSSHRASRVQGVCSGIDLGRGHTRRRPGSCWVSSGLGGLWGSFQPPSPSSHPSPLSFLHLGPVGFCAAAEGKGGSQAGKRSFPQAPSPIFILSRARELPPLWEVCNGQFLTLSM